MELFNAITQRRSHRGEFRTDAISQEHLDQLIQAAQWAPSPFNTQPWEFLIIREAAGKNTLAEVDRTECYRAVQRQHFSGRQ